MPDAREFSPLTRAVLLAAGLLVAGLVFQELVTLLVAILITVLLAIPLSAMADRLEPRRVPRWLGALVGLLIGLAFITGLMAIVIPSFVDQTEEFVDQVPATVDSLRERLNDAGGPGTGAEAQQFVERYTDNPQELIGPLASIGLNVAGVLAAIALIMITAYYMAVNPAPLLSGIQSLFPPTRREWARAVMARLRSSWVGWMQGVLVDMAITGVLVYIGLELVGLELTIFFAVFSAILVIVPYFGAILGAIPPTLFALADGTDTALLTLGVYVLIQQIEGNLTIPLVMANRVRLHPALVAIGVVVVGQLFGFIGLFVAVPILAAIVIAVDELWVKPQEARAGLRAAAESEIELARG
jgi:predicted PurR-regulated permease PerM